RRLCPHRDSQRSERARAPCASRTPERQPNIIAATVFAARGALSSLVIVEFVFIWGGAGLTFVQALGNRRLELASALALAFAVGSALLALAADLVRTRVRVGT